MFEVHLLGAGGADDEQPRIGRGADEEVEELEGLRIAPLEVVQDQEQWRGAGGDGSCERLEQPAPFPPVRRDSAGNGPIVDDLGEQTGDLGPPHRLQPIERWLHCRRPQHVDDRRVRQRSFGLVGARRDREVTAARTRGGELPDQAGLADAGFPADEHEPGEAASGGRPARRQPLQLLVTSDQRGTGRDGHPPAVRGCRDQLLVLGGELGARAHAELPLERPRAFVVHPQGPHPPARPRVQQHQPARAGLVERVELQQLLRVADGRGAVAPLVGQVGEPAEHRPVALPETLAVRLHPVVVAVGQEVAPVERPRPLQHLGVAARLGRSGGVLELDDVHDGRSIRHPLHRPRTDLKEPVRLGDRPAEVVQGLTEVGTGLGIVRIRPEQEREVLAGLGRVAVEDQERQQRHQAGRAQGGHDLWTDADLGRAEHQDAQFAAGIATGHRAAHRAQAGHPGILAPGGGSARAQGFLGIPSKGTPGHSLPAAVMRRTASRQRSSIRRSWSWYRPQMSTRRPSGLNECQA